MRITPHLGPGSCPLMSPKEARTEAQRLRARLEQGHDPQVVRLLEKQAIVKAKSVERSRMAAKNRQGSLQFRRRPAC